MKILFIYPRFPDTFWSFKHALNFISRKAFVPPLGLITISAMLPPTWKKKLVDMNVSELKANDILWADYVFISAMNVQKASVDKVIEECRKYGVKIVAGGPFFTREYNNYPQIDHFVLNEAEITLPIFLKDLNSGITPKRIYKTDVFADMTSSPVPDYHLLSAKKYAAMNIQVTRGCPFACDFCEVTSLLGRKVRMKQTRQVIDELETLYKLNWRGMVFFVDDNFIGRRRIMKTLVLPAIKKWMQDHKYPFTFTTQTSVDLADDDELLTMMVESGFSSAFIGIETPEDISLQECVKSQNRNRDLLHSVQKIQKAGINVSGGFIVGFDNDPPNIFQKQIDFIQKSGIVTAMVGLLNAPRNTKLYQRLKAENRLTNEHSGNNTDYTMNFIPKMNHDVLLEGYRTIIKNIYSIKPYYYRIRRQLLFRETKPAGYNRIEFSHIKAFFRSIIVIGIINKGRWEFWKLFIWTLLKRPALLVDAITFAVYGYHFRTIFGLRK